MNPYLFTLWSLAGAVLLQSLVTGLSMDRYLFPKQQSGQRAWLAIAIGSLLLALNHGYALELALRTGLYDLRQAVLSGLTAVFFALGIHGIKRPEA